MGYKDGHKSTLRRLGPGTALGMVFVDPHTGTEYSTRAEMRREIKRRRTLWLTHFAQLVADRTLGQEPWERLPVEPELQYARFREYLKMGPAHGSLPVKGRLSRSIARLAQKLEMEGETLGKVATRYHWVLRAQCWDREVDRQEDEEFKEAKRTAARRHARMGQKLQAAAERGLVPIMAGAVEISPTEVARLAETGMKMERLAHDQSTSNDAHQHQITFTYTGEKPKWADKAQDVTQIKQQDA